jgi:TATA-box binding protein (TBP) (component of TFIID and TFIIIB)
MSYLSIEKYAQEYTKFMDISSKNGHTVNVSTITLLCTLSVPKIDIQGFTSSFQEDGVTIKISKNNKQFELTKRGKVKKTFFNQVTLNYYDISNKSIKVFSNGKLQVTGISSCYECHHVIGLITTWLNKKTESFDVLEPIRVTDAYFGMLNVNFSVKSFLDLSLLNHRLNMNDNVMSVYNPETYPAINMKLQLSSGEYMCSTKNNKNISIFVFGTGNIVITGGKSLEGVTEAYSFIVKQLSETILLKPNVIPQKKTLDKYIYGYKVKQYLSCVNK